jgi:hypothetical protein
MVSKMTNIAQHATKASYSINYAFWPDYKSIPVHFIVEDSQYYYCTDEFADQVNEALIEADTPGKFTEYNTVEEFLKSLKKH